MLKEKILIELKRLIAEEEEKRQTKWRRFIIYSRLGDEYCCRTREVYKAVEMKFMNDECLNMYIGQGLKTPLEIIEAAKMDLLASEDITPNDIILV